MTIKAAKYRFPLTLTAAAAATATGNYPELFSSGGSGGGGVIMQSLSPLFLSFYFFFLADRQTRRRCSIVSLSGPRTPRHLFSRLIKTNSAAMNCVTPATCFSHLFLYFGTRLMMHGVGAGGRGQRFSRSRAALLVANAGFSSLIFFSIFTRWNSSLPSSRRYSQQTAARPANLDSFAN